MFVSLKDHTKLWFDTEGLTLVPDGDAMWQRPTLNVMHGTHGGTHNLKNMEVTMDNLASAAI